MTGDTEMTKKIPRKRENIVEVEAEKENTEVGVEVERRENGVEAGAKRKSSKHKNDSKEKSANEVEVAVKEELTVLRKENENIAPAKKI